MFMTHAWKTMKNLYYLDFENMEHLMVGDAVDGGVGDSIKTWETGCKCLP